MPQPLGGPGGRFTPVKPGDRVQVNDLLLVLDAMRMEIKINTQSAGIDKSIEVSPNDAVKPDQVPSTWNRRADSARFDSRSTELFPNLRCRKSFSRRVHQEICR